MGGLLKSKESTMKAKYLFLLVFFLILVSCSKSEETSEILPPTPVNLIFPVNNTECTEGDVVDAHNSIITFQWEAAENATSYEFFLEDLESNILHQEITTGIELEVISKRGMAFKWYVNSQSDATDETVTSNIWNFYNAGEGVIMHVPFPAELLSPSQGESFPGGTTSVTLEWNGNDLDNDILEYEVYFGESNPPISLERTISDESIEVNTSSGKTYYWSIKTVDKNNNSSNSSVFKFIVN